MRANGGRLGGGGFLPRHALARREQSLAGVLALWVARSTTLRVRQHLHLIGNQRSGPPSIGCACHISVARLFPGTVKP